MSGPRSIQPWGHFGISEPTWRRAVAEHEAAHAVLGAARGAILDKVELEQRTQGGQCSSARCVWRAGKATGIEVVGIFAAGPAQDRVSQARLELPLEYLAAVEVRDHQDALDYMATLAAKVTGLTPSKMEGVWQQQVAQSVKELSESRTAAKVAIVAAHIEAEMKSGRAEIPGAELDALIRPDGAETEPESPEE